MSAVSMPNLATSLALVETATKWRAIADSSWPSPDSSQPRAVCALVIVSSVVKVFGDDEQGLRRIELLDRFGKIGAVDIGHEAERHRAVAVVLQRLIRHDRAEIRAADADVDHIADALAGMPLPVAPAQPIGEIRHLVQDGMDVGHHIAAIEHDRGAALCAQCGVKYGAVLRDVDPVAPEHGVDMLPQTAFVGQLEQ